MRQFLDILNVKAYQNRKVGIIENGTWAPSAGRIMKQYVEGFKDVTLAEPAVTIKSALKPENIAALESLAEALSL